MNRKCHLRWRFAAKEMTKNTAWIYTGKRSRGKTEKSYLGVRVRMPVKDMLRNIRIAKGMDPKDIQVGYDCAEAM